MPETEPDPAAPPRLTKAHVAGLVAGNILEFYDFTVFAYFATQIGLTMFATQAGADGSLPALATFAVGFLARPIGAAIIGRYADIAGRKPAMTLSFALMGGALLVLALTPPASMLGIWSAVIMIAARLIQGFALGGEVGPTTALLIEAAPPGRRGLYGAWQIASQGLAVLLAGLIGLSLSLVLSPAALTEWGWRVALLFGALILPIGFGLRRVLPETFAQPEIDESFGRPKGSARRVALVGFVLILAGTMTTYTLQYMSTYSIGILKLSPSIAFGATTAIGLTMFTFALVGGHFSDHAGRRPLIVVPRAILVCLIYPLFLNLNRNPSLGSLLLAAIGLTSLYAMSSAPANVSVAEGFGRSHRSVAYAVTYTIAVSVFGGAAQYCLAYLIQVTGSRMVPAWWLIGASAIGAAAGLVMPLVDRRGARHASRAPTLG